MDEQELLYASGSNGSKLTDWKRRRRSRRCAIFVAVLLTLMLTGFSLAVAVVMIRHKYEESRTLNELTPNSTWLAAFNGEIVDHVMMDLWGVEYGTFLELYAFSRKPELSIYQNFLYQVGTRELSSAGAFYPMKFYLNAGARMNVSFCSNRGVRLLIIQYDDYIRDLDDPNVRKNARFSKRFAGQTDGNNCSLPYKVSFLCNTSSAYQFVFVPWHFDNAAGQVKVEGIVYNGNLTQYNISSGAKSYCRTSSIRASCSVDLPGETSSVVVVSIGNIPTDHDGGHIVTGMKIKSSVRQSFVERIIGGVIGGGMALAIVILIVGCCWNSKVMKN